jgi:hypothetical protein
MPGSPIILGSAASNTVLTPDAGSSIKTDEYGIQRGTIRFQLGDQAYAQNLRPAAGSLYTGSLPQFKDFLVDEPGDILGGEGKTAFLPVTCAKLDPKFVKLPVESQDIEFRDVTITLGVVVTVLPNIPVPHPVLTYKFATDQKPIVRQRGTWLKGGQLPGAPIINKYVFLNSTASKFGLVFIIQPPDSWLCIKEDIKPLCAGKLYQIEQQWKQTYYFYGLGQ